MNRFLKKTALVLSVLTSITTIPLANSAPHSTEDATSIVDRASAAAEKTPADSPYLPRTSGSNSLVDVANGVSSVINGSPTPDGVITDTNGGQVVAQNLSDGDVRLSKVIRSSKDSPSFELTFEGASHIASLGNSGFVIYDSQGNPSAQALNPWARDAAGKRLDTRYEIEGNQVRQVVDVDTNTQYPVTADPRFRRWKFIIPEIYFDRGETGRARNPAVIGGMLAGICATAGAATLGVACGIGAAEAAGIAAVASNSHNDGKCMALRAGLVPVTVNCD